MQYKERSFESENTQFTLWLYPLLSWVTFRGYLTSVCLSFLLSENSAPSPGIKLNKWAAHSTPLGSY